MDAIPDRSQLLLSLQRALLDVVPTQLRQASIELDPSSQLVRVKFEYGSWVPHALAGLATLALLAAALVRTTGSILTRLSIGVLAFWLWLFFWLCGSFIVTCSMGDCI